MLHRAASGLRAATLAGSLAATALAATASASSTDPAEAAMAHNSQAGSWGPTTHNGAPTPYFTAGG